MIDKAYSYMEMDLERRRGYSVPMISTGLEGRLSYMTYPEPWRGPPKQPPEFLRPAPKPVPPVSRYNGVNTSPNGTRLAPSPRSINKYPSPPSISAPVNLTQHKDEIVEELPPYSPYGLFPTPTHFTHFPSFATMYQTPYPHLLRSTYPTTPIPPLETFSPTTPTSITSSTFLSPPSTYSPPSSIKPGQNIMMDKRIITSQPPTQATQSQTNQSQQVAFKVPSGKEGSLKHRILLTRPDDGHRNVAPLDLQKSVESNRRRLNATMSPPPRSPRSPKKPVYNNVLLNGFMKGSLIHLASGKFRRIEDMTTEDFISSADHSPDLRLVHSTVVKLEENHTTGTVTITLSYNQRSAQAQLESTVEHPYFVFGQGWASCNPDRTQQFYQLLVHRLQVGDILVSLMPRDEFTKPSSSRTTTIMTTATSTAMTVRQTSVESKLKAHQEPDQILSQQIQPINLHTSNHPPQPLSPDSLAARKRRWSAPEQICDDDEQQPGKRHRLE